MAIFCGALDVEPTVLHKASVAVMLHAHQSLDTHAVPEASSAYDRARATVLCREVGELHNFDRGMFASCFRRRWFCMHHVFATQSLSVAMFYMERVLLIPHAIMCTLCTC